MWSIFRNADDSNATNKEPNGLHESIPKKPEKWKLQIEKDLPRTFRGHPALDEDGRNALRRILTAYARHNPSVGYSQITSYIKPQIVRQHETIAKIPCFMTQSRIEDSFPTVELHFAGGAVMTLHPNNYLMLQTVAKNSTFDWCMAWKESGIGRATVFGDIALTDKVLVHDSVNKRFGWKNQECQIFPCSPKTYPTKVQLSKKGSKKAFTSKTYPTSLTVLCLYG